MLVLAALLACEDGSYYAYGGNEYDASLGCLDGVAVLDIFEGSDPGSSCGAKCVTAPDFDGGVHVYVSTECGPTPIGADATGTNPQCVPALAAFTRDDECLDGGGSTNPIPDAGAPNDAVASDVNTD